MEIHQITDFNAAGAGCLRAADGKPAGEPRRPENALFVAEARWSSAGHWTRAARPVSFLMEQKHIEGKGAALLARCPDVPVYAAELDVLTQLTGFHLHARDALCDAQAEAARPGSAAAGRVARGGAGKRDEPHEPRARPSALRQRLA